MSFMFREFSLCLWIIFFDHLLKATLQLRADVLVTNLGALSLDEIMTQSQYYMCADLEVVNLERHMLAQVLHGEKHELGEDAWRVRDLTQIVLGRLCIKYSHDLLPRHRKAEDITANCHSLLRVKDLLVHHVAPLLAFDVIDDEGGPMWQRGSKFDPADLPIDQQRRRIADEVVIRKCHWNAMVMEPPRSHLAIFAYRDLALRADDALVV